MARPSIFPRWATGGTAAIAAPSSPEQDVGHIPQTILTAQLANWLQNLVYQWLVYLDSVAGGPLTTTVTPSAANATAAAAIGTSTDAPRADHVHSVPTAAPTALAIGSTVVTGVSASLARADHVHAMPAAGTPGAVTPAASASAGAATTFARSDHAHSVAVAAPTGLTVGGANAAGASTSFVRADHVHAITAAVPLALTVGGSSVQGVATTFNASDHVHALPAFGAASGTFCQGSDTRLSDDRVASSLRTASATVGVAAAPTPIAGQVLTADLTTQAIWSFPAIDPGVNGCRLAPTTDDSIPADGTFTTVYLAPVVGNAIALYRAASSRWLTYYVTATTSYVLAGRTAGLPFDIFVFASGTVPTLEVLDWTSATARATALVRQDGVWTKTGDPTRRYVGTVRPRSATTYQVRRTTAWNTASGGIDLWNVDNRKEANVTLQSPGSDWSYATATYRQANATANAQIDTIAGLATDCISLSLLAIVSSTGVGAGDKATVAISNPTTGLQTGLRGYATVNATVGSVELAAFLVDTAPLGVGAYKWLEKGTGSGTVTWYGDAVTENQSGMQATVWC